MGFANAVADIGKNKAGKSNVEEFSDIDCFIQYPIENIPPQPSEEKPKKLPGRELRFWLEVEDIASEQLKITGIAKMDMAYFLNGNADEQTKKRRYLYRDPVGKAAEWRYSPVYKLGAGAPASGKEALLGKNEDWRNKKSEARFAKLRKSTLDAFEKQGVFSNGSVEIIMEWLEQHVEEIAHLWDEKRSSYLMVFSVFKDGRFLYPVEVPAFLSYFRKKISEQSNISSDSKECCCRCAVCNAETSAPVNMDKVFAFSTFDKASFLPGLSPASVHKVFPICQQCYKYISEGRNEIDNKFLDTRSIPGVMIYIIPELLLGTFKLSQASGVSQDFIESGLKRESAFSQRVMSLEDEIIFHFVFWEKNQAQERVLYMVEDVPPSRLRRLEELWKCSSQSSLRRQKDSDAVSSLADAIWTIRRTLVSLGGLRDNDITYLNDLALEVIAALLSGRRIEISRVKAAIVSYLKGLCSTPDWVQRFSVSFAHDAQCIIDFLYRVDEEG